jgi:hypothetical protein
MRFSRVRRTGFAKSRATRGALFLLLSATGWATQQQVALTSTNKAVVAIPSVPPYSTVATWHFDWRVTVTSANASAWVGFGQYFLQIGSFFGAGASYDVRPYVVSAGVSYSYRVDDTQDGSGLVLNCPPIAFGQDTVVRLQKNATNMTCETWNANGGNYQIAPSPAFTSTTPGLRPTLQIGDGGSNLGILAYLRGYTGTVPLNGRMPHGSSGGNLWDYEFNGNLNDTSGKGLNLTGTGTFTYSTAPSYTPACVMPAQTTFRAGYDLTVITAANSVPLDGGETLTYAWQQIPSNVLGTMQAGLQFINPTAGDLTDPQTLVNPTFRGIVFGSFTVQLTVTDASGQATTCSTKYGAIAADANGSVIISNAAHAQILGPIIAIYASPWAAEPQQHLAYANRVIEKLNGTSPLDLWFVDYWNQAATGTVGVSNGSQTVVGSGTTFTTTFCQGPGSPTLPKHATSTAIAVWYPIASGFGLPAGTTGRRFGTVTSCTDDTHLTASFPTGGNAWQTDTYVGAGSGLSYSYVETQCSNITGGFSNCVGGWGFGNAPANYYDNVKALYALWYRTGLDDYLVAARKLADRWWSYPTIDKGITYETSNQGNPWASIAVEQRSMALTGLFMRNADNPPYDYGPGLRSVINFLIGQGTPNGTLTSPCSVGPTITNCGQDVRDGAYGLEWAAQDALYNSGAAGASPNPAQYTLDLAALSRDMNNRWGICQNPAYYPNGICTQIDNINSYYASWNTGGANFSVTVTNGSPTVTANGGTFTSTPFTACSPTACGSSNPPNAIWITSTGATQPSYPLQGDGNWYYVVYSNPATLTLTDINGGPVPYTGASNAAAGFQTITYLHAQNDPGYLGFYWQPYMTGILNSAYWFVSMALATSDPTNAANAATWALNNANAMATTGLNTMRQGGFAINGPYYAIGITCAGGGRGATYSTTGGCDTGLLGDRELNSETLNVATIAFRFFGSAPVLTLGDTMMAAMYAQPGEPGFDGTNILTDLVNPGFLFTTFLQHKWLGAFWGVGADWSWASTRVGGLRPPIPRVVQVSLDYQTATHAVLTVVQPDGTSSQVSCTTSPCPITIDAREGDHLVFVRYLNMANEVLAMTDPTVVKAQ